MERSLVKLEKISESLSSHQTYYTFNKIDEHLSEKYRKGRVNTAKWLNELIYHFIKREAKFIDEFKEHIQEQRKKMSGLNEGDFKEGVYDELTIVEKLLEEYKEV